MEAKKKAIYVHGLGSGASSTTVDIVRKVFSDYEWTAVEVNEDPVDSVNTINKAIDELCPVFLMGTSLGGLYLMYADMGSCEDDAIRFLFNPACDIARIIRETIGFGKKEYFGPREDGVQEYELNEAICARFENFIAGYNPTSGKGYDYAMFSIHDELIGADGVRRNQVVCYEAGYRILIDSDGGHRLRKATLRLAWKHLFNGRDTKYRIGDRILFRTNEPAIHFTRFYGDGTILDPGICKKDKYVGTITDIHPKSTPQLYFARTILPIDGFFCTLVREKDIIRLATNNDIERLTSHPFNDMWMTDNSSS